LAEANRVLKWESELAEERCRGTLEERDTVEGIVNGIEDDKNLWERLGVQMDNISTMF